MRFVDECVVRVEAGDGGNGCASFRREAFVPFGGPSGGDGGNGGSVVFVGDEGKNSLLDLTQSRVLRAARGENGRGSDQYGKTGESTFIRVPVGTVVKNDETDELVGELLEHGQELIVARGGVGGRGNKHFATPTDRAPRKTEPGTPGEAFDVRLELRVMADVGMLGFPNVGKSTFIAAVSRARPKIADYPFTTLVPQLGVVLLDEWVGAEPGDTFVVADIPGLIPGASEGAGLGIQFLKHVERTRVLLHLVTLDYDEEREPLADYDAVRQELEKFDAELAQRPEIVCLSKADVTEVREAYEELRAKFAERGIELHLISAATREGIKPVIAQLRDRLADAAS
ncbi:MAG TPA: GTPase ObgE [Polyangiaceae bacterium]|nr:GTPase ObgE [Polyangiaceae bacterium]